MHSPTQRSIDPGGIFAPANDVARLPLAPLWLKLGGAAALFIFVAVSCSMAGWR